MSVLQALSAGCLRLEKALLIFLAATVTALILLNVVTRSLDRSVFWVDELAIYTMIWLVMIGASAKIRMRKAIAVTLAETFLSTRVHEYLLLLVDIIVLGFAASLVVLSWLWFDPLALAATGFDTATFSSSTFNFIYQEPTSTIGLPKYVVWLIMPFTAVTMTLHATVNVLERATGRPHQAADIE